MITPTAILVFDKTTRSSHHYIFREKIGNVNIDLATWKRNTEKGGIAGKSYIKFETPRKFELAKKWRYCFRGEHWITGVNTTENPCRFYGNNHNVNAGLGNDSYLFEFSQDFEVLTIFVFAGQWLNDSELFECWQAGRLCLAVNKIAI